MIMTSRWRIGVEHAGKPRSRLWGFVLFTIAFTVFYGHLAIVANETAKRQQTSVGTYQCERCAGYENWFQMLPNAFPQVAA
jgi:hypothetical protein